MRKFASGHELAKEIGCSADVLKKTCKPLMRHCTSQADSLVEDHNGYAKNPGSDPFGKKVSSDR